MDCLTCGSREIDIRKPRYIVIPGKFIVPNGYLLCGNHKDLQYFYDDIYDENGNRKNIDHDSIIKINEKNVRNNNHSEFNYDR